jgi:F-type H+-transporting ATPase subunit delta
MDKDLLKISLTSIAGRYSRALFVTAQQQQVLEDVQTDLKKLYDYAQNNQSLWQRLSSKALTKQQVEQLWQQIASKLELGQLTMNFMVYLCQIKRLSLWPAIYQIYQAIIDEHQNKRQVLVESATTLSQHERESIQQALQKIWTKELILTFSTRRTVETGLVIRSNNLLFDASLGASLSTLHRLLRND